MVATITFVELTNFLDWNRQPPDNKHICRIWSNIWLKIQTISLSVTKKLEKKNLKCKNYFSLFYVSYSNFESEYKNLKLYHQRYFKQKHQKSHLMFDIWPPPQTELDNKCSSLSALFDRFVELTFTKYPWTGVCRYWTYYRDASNKFIAILSATHGLDTDWHLLQCPNVDYCCAEDFSFWSYQKHQSTKQTFTIL